MPQQNFTLPHLEVARYFREKRHGELELVARERRMREAAEENTFSGKLLGYLVQVVYLLNNQTRGVTRSLKLSYPGLTDLALHPTRPLSIVRETSFQFDVVDLVKDPLLEGSVTRSTTTIIVRTILS